MDHSSHSSSSSGDEARTMGRHHGSRPRLPKRLELDLSAAISLDQKAQLQKLASSIIDRMQSQLCETFDNLGLGSVPPGRGINPPRATCNAIPNPCSDKYRHMYGDVGLSKETDLGDGVGDGAGDGEGAEKPTDKADVPAGLEAPSPKWKIPKSPDEARDMYGKTDVDVLISSLSELKHDAVAHFGKWRASILRRIQDIVIKNGGTSGNVSGRVLQQTSGNVNRPGNAVRGRLPTPSGPSASATDSAVVLARLHTPIPTPLQDTPKEKRALILHSMMLILLGMDHYSLYSRIFLVKLASSLNIPTWVLHQDEVRVSGALSKIIENIPPAEIVQKRTEEAKSSSRRWKPGTAPGAVATALAPSLAAAGVGTVFGGLGLDESATAGLLGPMAENIPTIGILFGLYGARQSTRTMESYAKDIQDFGFVPLHGPPQRELNDPKDLPTECRRMRVTIGIGGLVMNHDSFADPWQVLGQRTEAYTLKWELEALTRMAVALDTLLGTSTWNMAKREITSKTVFERLKQALWPAGLVKISKVIENPWCVGMVRAEKAGAALADILMSKVFGERPVNLVGYSLGARVIYSCLMALAEKRAFGLVENVAMMGAPCPSEVRVWASMRSVVAGRLINAYSNNDYILSFLYRNSTWQYGIAGLQSIQGVPNVENLDTSDIVTSHLRYTWLVGCILKKVGWEDVEYAQVSQQEQALVQRINQERRFEEEHNRRANAEAGGDRFGRRRRDA
ncbi:hypothetical protein GGS23DRAFT_596618 [Durotheca rogersii]|uniref:uncharacterized protein n=1 Tax=Durotheca rogersii TaxID=419775 RepID=UPI00221E5D72|nr:uncharacterized protein GGS23DRAFT_596618 [Durotheca rogersii]KAI5863441.1 hypothetical protein GGS23DRAFT_596618 [Durotheca rogersii]